MIEVKRKYEEAGDEENVALILNNMGELYREHFNDPKGSLRFYREAIAIDVRRKDNLEAENNLVQAKAYYLKSISISTNVDYENGLFYGYMGLSGLCSKQKKPPVH